MDLSNHSSACAEVPEARDAGRRESGAQAALATHARGDGLPVHKLLLCGCLLLLGVACSSTPQAVTVAVTEVCVGEPVELSGVNWSAIDTATGTPIPDLGEIALSDYVILEDASESFAATLTPLALDPEDSSRSSSTKFYFHRAGTYSVITTDGEGHRVHADYRVSSPTLEVTRRALSDVNHYRLRNKPTLELGARYTAGAVLEFVVSMSKCSGTISDVQTLSFTDIDGFDGGVIQVYDTAGEFLLDFDPERHDTWQYDFNVTKRAGDQFDLRYEDSPKTRLTNEMLCASTRADFRYYVLYKPDSEGAVWIPFAGLDWQLKMHIRRPDLETPWVRGADVEYDGKAVVPDSFVTPVEHWPTWTNNWTSIGMVEMEGDCADSR